MACILLCCLLAQRPNSLGAVKESGTSKMHSRNLPSLSAIALFAAAAFAAAGAGRRHLRQHSGALASQCGEPGVPGDPDRRIRRLDPVRRYGPRAYAGHAGDERLGAGVDVCLTEPDVGPSDHAYAVQRRQFRRESGTRDGYRHADQYLRHSVAARSGSHVSESDLVAREQQQLLQRLCVRDRVRLHRHHGARADHLRRRVQHEHLGLRADRRAGTVRITEFRPRASGADHRQQSVSGHRLLEHCERGATTRTAARAVSASSAAIPTGRPTAAQSASMCPARPQYCKARCRARSTEPREPSTCLSPSRH